MDLDPHPNVVDHLRRRGWLWHEVEADLAWPQIIRPELGHEARRRLVGCQYVGIIVPHMYRAAWFLINVREAEKIDHLPIGERVVGYDAKRPLRKVSGGEGRRWPSTWGELDKRINALPNARTIIPASKHIHVLLRGQLIDVLPTSTSDHRALLNVCLQLRRKGLDVSR